MLAAFLVVNLSEWAFVTALSIYAYRIGGTLAVGFVGFRFLPGALSSALLAPLVDGQGRILTRVARVRTVLLGLGAAGVVAQVALPIVLVIVALDAVVAAPYRPAQSRLIPRLARAPTEISASAAGVSMGKTLGQAVGALAGGVSVALVAPGSVMAGAAVMMAAAAALTDGLDTGASPVSRVLGGLGAGVASIPRVFRHKEAAPLVIASGLRTLVRGLWTALLVVVALRLFALGSSGVGVLNAASGAGAAVALPITASLIGRARLGGACALAFVIAGLSLSVVGTLRIGALAVPVVFVWGVAMALSDATSLSLLHRLLDASTVSRTVGVMESLKLSTEGLGALLAPALVAVFGIRLALILAGLPLPLMIVLGFPRMRGADIAAAGRGRVVSLLHGVSVLRGLDMASLEDVASRARRIVVSAGTDVVREGEPGDDFYVIQAGETEVLLSGFRIGRLRPGMGFGERALLRATPRTATVRTLTATTLYAIDRTSFLSAITGQPPEAFEGVNLPVRHPGPDPASRPLAEVLAHVPLLSELAPTELDRLVKQAKMEDWEPGAVIVREGDRPTAVYLVISGRAETTIERRHVSDLLPGDTFGEIAILHRVPRIATVAAVGPLRTCRLPIDAVTPIFDRQGTKGRELW